jgi:hypothetical protein
VCEIKEYCKYYENLLKEAKKKEKETVKAKKTKKAKK